MPATYRSSRRLRVLATLARFPAPVSAAKLFPALGLPQENPSLKRKTCTNLRRVLACMVSQGLATFVPSTFHGGGTYEVTPAGRALLDQRQSEEQPPVPPVLAGSPPHSQPPAKTRHIQSASVIKCPLCSEAMPQKLARKLRDEHHKVPCLGCGWDLADLVGEE